MTTVAVAQNYARALYHFSQEQEISDAVLSSLEFLEKQFNYEPRLKEILTHPLVNKKEKKKILEELFPYQEEETPPAVINFLFLLVDKERNTLLEEIMDWYRSFYREERDIQVVEVTVPGELKEEQKDIIVENMKRYTGRQVELKEKIDPSVKGGVILKIGSRMLDGSLDTRLKRMEEELLQSGSK